MNFTHDRKNCWNLNKERKFISFHTWLNLDKELPLRFLKYQTYLSYFLLWISECNLSKFLNWTMNIIILFLPIISLGSVSLWVSVLKLTGVTLLSLLFSFIWLIIKIITTVCLIYCTRVIIFIIFKVSFCQIIIEKIN